MKGRTWMRDRPSANGSRWIITSGTCTRLWDTSAHWNSRRRSAGRKRPTPLRRMAHAQHHTKCLDKRGALQFIAHRPNTLELLPRPPCLPRVAWRRQARRPTNAMTTSTIVSKLWNYCNVLRDDGMSYGDYVEQLTYLLLRSTMGIARVWI
jgi:hypothetical protein